MPNHYFVEGNDTKFIGDIIKHKNKSLSDDIFTATKGWN